MKMRKILYNYIEKITNAFEIVIAVLLILVIAIKVAEMFINLMGFQIVIISMDFERILSAVLTLVIGVEFIKMLCKHTPETVIDVLLFAMARQIVIYHENSLDLLLGIIAIIGLFFVKKYLTNKNWDFSDVRKSFSERKENGADNSSGDL